MVKALLWFVGMTAVAVALALAGCSGGMIEGDRGPGQTGNQGTPGSGGAPVGQPTTACTQGASLANARVWRLTDQEYVNVVAEVFGVRMPSEITQAASAAADFTATSESPELTVQASTATAYATAAHTAAVGAVLANLNVFLPCGTTAPPDQCVQRFIQNRVARAFGRPLTDSEVQDLLGIYHVGVSTESVAAGIRLVIEATLQAPSFIYRTELGSGAAGGAKKVTLTAHEVATAVSFALMDSVPDDELWAKAESGALLKTDVLAAEVDRLLSLPAVQANLGQKAGYWLGVEKLNSASFVPKDTTLFPEFTDSIKNDIYKGAQMFVGEIMAHGKVDDLLTSNKVYANANVAKVYNIAGATGTDLAPVEVPGPDRGGGIITQPAVLAASAHPDRGDVIHRGLFIYYALVCGTAFPPPPANALNVASTFPANATERQKATLRANASEGCGACHGVFDPLGLTTEQYDPIGRYTPKDSSGQPIDASSTLVRLGPDLDGPVSGLGDLITKLRGGRRVSDCAVGNLAKPLLGRDDLATDHSCELQQVKDKLATTGSFAEYYRSVLTSAAFMTRDVLQ
ncbi:MAG TPA: DUF1592 domain-containing protein [Polyangia bacterium]|nr:DUF1592 domain-containing protein [Polyangia bacterium]